jgi:hypothetical protein
MTVRVYRSTDVSAPVLSGTAGALCTVLDAVLVNGYGSQPAAGWTIAFTAASKRAYRMSTTGATGMYLNVDDTGGGTGGAREAFMTGFQTMSALATGTGQFPTGAVVNIGTAPAGALVARKSSTLDAVARAWTIVANESCFYFFPETNDNVSPTRTLPFMFGDIFSHATSDPYRCAIIGRNNVNDGSTLYEWFGHVHGGIGSIPGGHYIAANATGSSVSVPFGKHTDAAKCALIQTSDHAGAGTASASTTNRSHFGYTANNGLMPYPNPSDGGLYLAPVWVHHNNYVRGYMKGLWAPCHSACFNQGDVITGTGQMAGKTFVAMTMPYNTTSVVTFGIVLVETSDTWS